MSEKLQDIAPQNRLSDVTHKFLSYATVERGLAEQTISKYQECLRQVSRIIGDKPMPEYSKADVLSLKSAMLARSHSVGRQVSILAAFKGLLLFCRDELALSVLDP